VDPEVSLGALRRTFGKTMIHDRWLAGGIMKGWRRDGLLR